MAADPLGSDFKNYDNHETEVNRLNHVYSLGHHEDAEVGARSLLFGTVRPSHYHRGRLHLLLADILGTDGDAEEAVRLLIAFRDYHLNMAEARLGELRAAGRSIGPPARPFFKIPAGPWSSAFTFWSPPEFADVPYYLPGFIRPSWQTAPQYANGAARSRRLSQTGLYEDATLAADGGKKRRTDD
ncbi:hypothetical protein CPLU01_04265 [Colletotrichum plurivorum]|uniref:Uncharacterized protein n=1 Tax=Colletotrichum plurivorum TaxID=2175906 RepID=A0A8H6KQ25_9PEZI|nr:hypothetical protein CPLU01_04265 [Colletotrichum plurivorum]